MIQRTERLVAAPEATVRRLLRSVLLVVIGFAASSAHAQFTGPLADKDLLAAAPGIVISVQFQGNDSLSSPELQTVVSTRVPSWFQRTIYHIPWIGPAIGETWDTIDYAKLQSDTAHLNAYYKDRGFLLAKSTFEVRANRQDVEAYQDWLRKRAAYRVPPTNDQGPLLHDTVIFHIHEGPSFTISRVTFTGLENLPEEFQPELTEHVSIKSGTRWDVQAEGAEATRIDSIMIENGYPFFNRDSTVVPIDTVRKTVRVEYYYSTGSRLKFGPVNIVYDTNSVEHTKVDPKVIRAQLLFHEGQWYKQSLVQRSEANLVKLNTFDRVRVSLDTASVFAKGDTLSDGMEVPVQVFVRLHLRAEVSPGIYAGTGAQGIVLGGTAGYNNRNLSGKADNLNANAAYQLLPTTQKRESGNLDYTLPFVAPSWKRTPLTVGTGASYEEQQAVPGTTVRQYFISTYSGHVGSNIILSRLDDRTTVAPDITLQLTHAESPDSLVRTLLPLNQYSFILGASYSDDRTNDVFNPTSGHLFNGLIDGAYPWSPIWSSYVRGVPLYKQYIDLSSKGTSVIAGRLRLGKSFIFSNNPAAVPPPERRFYGGGSNSFRGWPQRTMLVSSDSNANPDFGGYNVLEASIEFRYAPFQYEHEWTSWQKLSSALRVVAFLDGGNVWDNSVDIIARPKLSLSGGIGIRYNTPFGPLRFDWGLKLYDPSGKFTHTDYPPIRPTDSGAWLWSDKRTFSPDIMTFQVGIGQAF